MPGERSLRTLRLESGSRQAEADSLVILQGMSTIEISLTTISRFATLIWKAEREVSGLTPCAGGTFETSAFFYDATLLSNKDQQNAIKTSENESVKGVIWECNNKNRSRDEALLLAFPGCYGEISVVLFVIPTTDV